MKTLFDVQQWYFKNIDNANEKEFRKLRTAFAHAKRMKQPARVLQLPMVVNGVSKAYDIQFLFDIEAGRSGKKKPYGVKVIGPSEPR